jgi:DHA1 family solute carrier family 18 vesicular amine transporter 1/2
MYTDRSDMTPDKHIGRTYLCYDCFDTLCLYVIPGQVGLATAGLSLGQLIGPPVGGALYTRFGYRAMFIFSGSCMVVDLIGRLLIIERKKSLLWEADPTPLHDPNTEIPIISDTLIRTTPEVGSNLLIFASANHHESPLNTTPMWTVEPVLIPNEGNIPSENSTVVVHNEPLSLLAVLVKLSRSPRALAALWISLTHA